MTTTTTTTTATTPSSWMQGFRASKGGKYIKFEDGETKIPQFFSDKEPQRMEKA